MRGEVSPDIRDSILFSVKYISCSTDNGISSSHIVDVEYTINTATYTSATLTWSSTYPKCGILSYNLFLGFLSFTESSIITSFNSQTG